MSHGSDGSGSGAERGIVAIRPGRLLYATPDRSDDGREILRLLTKNAENPNALLGVAYRLSLLKS